MTYNISTEAASCVIFVVYDGSVSLSQRKEAVEEMCRRFGEKRPFKILVNVRKLKMDLTSSEQKEFGEYLANHKGLSDARVAVLHEEQYNPNIMIDAIAFSNGYLLAEFTSQNEAVAWLEEI